MNMLHVTLQDFDSTRLACQEAELLLCDFTSCVIAV
jgi:hypothetical protein